MIIAIDFDGTIVRGKYPTIDGLQPYAKQVINGLILEGHYVIIWTCRAGDKLVDAVNYLLEQGIKFNRVNDHEPINVSQYSDSGPKIYAHCYIDDKNIFGFPGWKQCEKEIKRMEAEYKSEH